MVVEELESAEVLVDGDEFLGALFVERGLLADGGEGSPLKWGNSDDEL